MSEEFWYVATSKNDYRLGRIVPADVVYSDEHKNWVPSVRDIGRLAELLLNFDVDLWVTHARSSCRETELLRNMTAADFPVAVAQAYERARLEGDESE